MLWQTVIYFVYNLSLNYRSFEAIAGCPPNSSSSRIARQHTQRAVQETDCGPTVQISSEKTNGLQIRQIQTQWTITVLCAMLEVYHKLKTKSKTIAKLRNRFRLSGATYHKDRSTRRWKTSQIKRLKTCVVAWSCRWTLQTFTVKMEFWHLIIS